MSIRFHTREAKYSFFISSWSLWVACFLACFCNPVYSQQLSACGPSNSTPPLTCTANQWVRVTGELYAPSTQVGGASTSCHVNQTSTCNTAIFNSGLQANCNGPVGAEPCREQVDIADAMERAQCLRNVTEVGANVMYSCVKETDIFDLCDTTRQLSSSHSSSFHMVYLASPNFPASSSSGQLCSCTLQGSRLRVHAVQVTVVARLPWQADVPDGSDFEAVLAFRSQGATLFKSNECADCTRIDTLNTLLVSTGLQTVSEMTVTYSDFGLQNQNVWLEITELGPNLNISCKSTPLPSDRIVTTTTTSTTTASTIPTAAITTTTAAGGGAGGGSSVPDAAPPFRPGTTSSNRTPQRTTPVSRDLGGGAGKPRNDGSGGGSGDSSTVVVLVVVLILLMVLGGILGVILYRRRGQCGADGKPGIKPMVQAWCRDLECCACLQKLKATPGDSLDAEPAASGRDHKDFDDACVGPEANGCIAFGENVHPPRYNKNKPRHKNATTVQTADGELTIIQNQVYQSHREMVEEEVARIKQSKRDQRALDNSGTIDQVAQAGNTAVSDNHSEPDTGVHSSDSRDLRSRDLSLAEQEYATIRDYEPMELKPHSAEAVEHDAAQDPAYVNAKAAKDAASHRKHKDLKKENSYSYETNQPSSRHNLPSSDISDSVHNTSVESGGGGEPPKVLGALHTRDLLSPEERNMFAALGLSGDTLEPSLDVSYSNTEQTGRRPRSEEQNPKLTGTTQTGVTENTNDLDLTETPEHLYTSLKPKKASKPELVSDILELSLRNIKGQRRGQGSDEGSGAGDGDTGDREEVCLGSPESQVQMSEC